MKNCCARHITGLCSNFFHCLCIYTAIFPLIACGSLPVIVQDTPLNSSKHFINGNNVELLQDGLDTHKEMLNSINSANENINMETYIFDDDSVGNQFSDALIAKKKQGVNVNVIYDSVGTLNTSSTFFSRLTDAGINVLEFNPVNPLVGKKDWDINQRDHRKLLIVDGKTAFLGGINISSVHSGSVFKSRAKKYHPGKFPWRDTHLKIEGPAVSKLQTLFMETWTKQQGEPLAEQQYFPALQQEGSDVVRIIGSSPDEAYSLIYVALISALRSAKTEIWIANAYFVPDPQLMAALKEAAAHGVDVKLIVPGKTDSGLVFHAGRAHYTELLKAGVKLYERHDALLHVKTAVIDGTWSTVGSTNLDWRSFLHNQEVNAVVRGPGFGKKMRTAFMKDIEKSEEITLEKWRKRPLSAKIKEQAGLLFAYWL